jgi:FkbM family methyltransferase
MKHVIPKPLKIALRYLLSCATWDQWAVRSWSQEGEDKILSRIFERKKNGFYVDIGAHHPKRFSNTFLLYNRGWQGINIDAMPGSMRAFQKTRPRDINLELGIGEEQSTLDYYVFNEPALNSFSRELSEKEHAADSSFFINKVIKVKVMPLSDILKQYLPDGQNIDFMSIDVEGLDLQVLKSNDWTKYRPSYVLAEVLGTSLHEIDKSEIGRFMFDNGYDLYAKSMNTVFFKDSSSEYKTTSTILSP